MSWEISNNISSYLTCCKEASKNEDLFNNFKQDSRYRQILEHVSHVETS